MQSDAIMETLRLARGEPPVKSDYWLAIPLLPVVAVVLNFLTLVNWRMMAPYHNALVRSQWWADLAHCVCYIAVARAGLVILSNLKLKTALGMVLSGAFLFLFLTNAVEWVFMSGSLFFPR